uniref:SAM domain-containing protein n=1 Tax=Gasterosteus aculeatus TaxID=69293 RepID=G3NFK1_GASAC
SQHQSQIPAYVRNWTKEQVNQWLLQHVKLYSKYAERLQEEGVSGDCLVCFKKQDFLDLGLKSGPAVKILAELSKLDKKPEPAMQPIPHTSTEQKESPKHMAITQPDSYCKTESQTDKMVEKFSGDENEILKKSLLNQISAQKLVCFLKKNYADTFAGILQHLDKPAIEIEKITECYGFLLQQQFINQKKKTKETINYIMSNIVLYLLKSKSKHVESHSSLSALLLQTLQEVGLRYPSPDPYYLALLLLWPRPGQEDTEIGTYVRAIRKSKRMTLSFRIRNTIAILYLGKGEGLKRLVSKRQLDENFKEMRRDTLAELWRNGDIFRKKAIIKRLQRVSGTTEQGELFANYGKGKIPVRPALIGAIRSGSSTEKVSFYLGFAINGPLAYDIQYE